MKRSILQLVTVRIPVPYLKAIEEMINNGHATSRSEVIRHALRDYLERRGLLNA